MLLQPYSGSEVHGALKDIAKEALSSQSTHMLLLETAPHHQELNLSLPKPGCVKGQILPTAGDNQVPPLHTPLSITTTISHLLGTSLST